MGDIEKRSIPGLMEALREEGIDAVRHVLWDATGWHRDYSPSAWRNRSTEEQKKKGRGMAVRIFSILITVLYEAHNRQVKEVMKTLSEGPEGFYKSYLDLDPTQVKALLSAALGNRLEALYVLALHTGLRRSEILGLKWTDVDLDTGTLSVQRSLDTNGTFNPPKRNKSRRTIKLAGQAVEALKGHRARQNEERLRLGSLWEDHELLFPNRVGKPMNADNLYHREFKPLLQKAGLSGFTFHSLRHTCAALLLSKNVNPKIVQEMLGHVTISQTMETYSHVLPGMQDEAAALASALS